MTQRKKPWEMDKILLENWLKALRNGKYKQGGGYLYNMDNGKYCCLGVFARTVGCSAKTLNGKGFLGAYDVFVGKVPKLFREDKKVTGFESILSRLNDSCFNKEFFERCLKKYPTIKFSPEVVEFFKNVPGGKMQFSFERIAEFLEDNVEPIESEV